MSGRQVHAIRINLHTQTDRSIIIWLNDVSPKHCVQLMNPRRVQCSDSVMLTHNGEQTRQAVESIELYRVFPASGNGLRVRSAWHWMNLGRELAALPSKHGRTMADLSEFL